MSDSIAEIYDTHPEVTLDFSCIREAVQQGHRTPFLLIDPNLIRVKLQRFMTAMPRVRPHYAVKANPHPAILQVLASEGAGFEIASIAELDLLVGLGVPSGDIVYSNPIKSRDYLRYAAKRGVEWYVVDSLDELRKITGIKPDAKLYVRVATQNVGSDWPLTGKFGAAFPQCREIVTEAVALGADLAGVMFHPGSQCRNVENWRIGIDNATVVFGMMREAGLEPRLLNIGGGFPVRLTKPIPSIEKIGETVNAAIADLPESVRVIAEPGRYLVSDAAFLVSRVVGTAMREGVRWVYLDTGVFHGLMETVEGIRYHVHTEMNGMKIPCTVAGPSCDAMDVVMRDEMLSVDLQEGDYVYIANAGAYSTAYASNFNGFPMPEVVVLER